MNTFKVRRSLPVIVVGAICAGVAVLGLGSAAFRPPIDAVWLRSQLTAGDTAPTTETKMSKDAVWL